MGNGWMCCFGPGPSLLLIVFDHRGCETTDGEFLASDMTKEGKSRESEEK